MISASYNKEGFATDNADILVNHDVKIYGKFEVMLYETVYVVKIKGKHILGNRIYDRIRKLIQH